MPKNKKPILVTRKDIFAENNEKLYDTPKVLQSYIVNKINDFLIKNGIEVLEEKGVSQDIELKFMPNLNYYEARIKLSGEASADLGSIGDDSKDIPATFEGRTISLKIYNSESNLEPGEQDIEKRHRSILNAIYFYLQHDPKFQDIKPENIEDLKKELKKIPVGVTGKDKNFSLNDIFAKGKVKKINRKSRSLNFHHPNTKSINYPTFP